jgi:hypothetical protein
MPVVFPLQEATSEPSAEKLTPLTCELYFGCKLVTTLTTLCNGRLRLSLSGGQNAVYASPPLNLRLSPGERGKETKVPVAFQRRLARAQFHVPDLEGLVPGCRHDGLAVGRKNTRRDPFTAIF